MPTAEIFRQRYRTESVATASPARLIVMLYDRLLRDLDDARAALQASEHERAHTALQHAQDIVLELRVALQPDAWEGGPALAALYTFLLQQLIAATVANDVDKVASCRELVEPLADAWHEAAATVVTSQTDA